MGSTISQRRPEYNWAEMEGSMMSRVLKRGEQGEERPCSVEEADRDVIRISYCRV